MTRELLPSEIGARIERKAEQYFLQQVGGKLIARNYRTRGGEIDLIFECPRVLGCPDLVFVEVSAGLPGNWLSGLESVGGRKQRRLAHAIRHFLMRYRGRAFEIRIDVLDWDGTRFQHYRDVRI